MTRRGCVAVLILTACGESIPQPGSVRELVGRERAFAALSVDSGIRPAFLAFLADSSVLFRPHPVPGRAFTAGRPNPPGTLNWHPVRAMAAGGRDLGWTTGPYTYALNGDTAYGQFVSVWRRRDQGRWEVLLDLGISHPRDRDPDETLTMEDLPPDRASAAPAALRIALLRRDRLVLAAAQSNMQQAFEDAYAPNARLYREGEAPFALRAERLATLPAGPSTLSWEPTDARASSAGDLGMTYGALTSAGEAGWMLSAGEYRYVRIWRRLDGRWRIILEIVVGSGG